MANANDDLRGLYGEINFKKITKKRRILSSFIDFLLIVITYLLIFNFLGKPVITKIAKNDIDDINFITTQICEENSFPYRINQQNYNLVEIDMENYVAQLLNEDGSLSEEEAFDKYFDAVGKLTEKLTSDSNYVRYYSTFHTKCLYAYTISILLPVFIFEFIIPLTNKGRKTIGKFSTSTSLVNSKNNCTISNIKLVLRFIFIFVIEFVLFQIIFNQFSIIILALCELMFMLISQNVSSIHDLVVQTKVISDKYVNLIEE